ncbi:hypothetical protein FKW77_009667 [Venturia effusa]|uniref:HTH APSES-type domain-containing protein n=1 Tax=Venturia effusa TaxID=50376 RepID=A0A517LBQ4_9PEZI|nr:hypothetical protein FKW77_009667 [Venturia effusa]
MKVEDLLNPVRNHTDGQELRSGGMQAPSHPPSQEMTYSSRSPSQSLSYTSSPSMACSPSNPSGKGQKLRKDAPIIRKAQTKGVVQFPAYEAGDDEVLSAQYDIHQITPRGNIAEHCHKYPYSSDKKEFRENTGRDGFEGKPCDTTDLNGQHTYQRTVFQYTYMIPGDAKEYTVMWDYNIGLVRITPFFKSCKYTKTTPAKVLNVNPGLKNISYSITGGALAAQGYWMPFQCAKAVAETFAYSIRYALVPVFGKGFLDACLRPEHPNFGSFKIDLAVVAHCRTETKLWPLREDARATPASSRAPSEAPDTPRPERNILQLKQFKELRPKLAIKATSPESGLASSVNLGICQSASNANLDANHTTTYTSHGYVADRSSVAGGANGLPLIDTLTPIANECEEKAIHAGENAKGLLCPVKSRAEEDFETAHRHKRPRFMSV